MVLVRRLAFGLILVANASAEGSPSRDAFDCYPTPTAHVSGNAPVQIESPRSRIASDEMSYAAENEAINFAGHYVLAEIGCGAGCVRLAAIDAKTGAVNWMNETISDWPIQDLNPISYRSDSRLIIIDGQLNEVGSNGPHRLLFDGRNFLALNRNLRNCGPGLPSLGQKKP